MCEKSLPARSVQATSPPDPSVSEQSGRTVSNPPPLLASLRSDRRVQRTKRRLKGALAELLAEREYDRITVQEIVDRADVGRSTFYAHFESKEDLLFAGVERHLRLMVEAPPAGFSAEDDARRLRFSLPLLRHVRLQRRFFEATILGGSDARLRQISAGIMTDLVSAELARLDADLEGVGEAARLTRAEARSGSSRALVGAFMGLLDWWLRSADHLPAEAVDALFQRAAWGVLRARET